jgi:hypothetical protein
LYRALAAGGAPPVSADDGYDAVALQEDIWKHAGVNGSPALRQAVGT